MSFPSLFLQMELASPCRIYIHHFRDFSGLCCCRLLLECVIQYDFFSSCHACFIFAVLFLQSQAIIISLPSIHGAIVSVSTGEFVQQTICMVVQSRFLDQNLFPLWPWERHWGWVSHYVQVTYITSPYHVFSACFFSMNFNSQDLVVYAKLWCIMPARPQASVSSNFLVCWVGVGGLLLLRGWWEEIPSSASAPLPYIWIHISTWKYKNVAHHSTIFRCSC